MYIKIYQLIQFWHHRYHATVPVKCKTTFRFWMVLPLRKLWSSAKRHTISPHIPLSLPMHGVCWYVYFVVQIPDLLCFSTWSQLFVASHCYPPQRTWTMVSNSLSRFHWLQEGVTNPVITALSFAVWGRRQVVWDLWREKTSSCMSNRCRIACMYIQYICVLVQVKIAQKKLALFIRTSK